jgi:hypothetical protein
MGVSVDTTAGATFVPADAATYKYQIAWIWAGRNNFASGAQVKSDIAAKVQIIGHTRYLVGSILTSASDNASQVTAIQALNSELAARYGNRFVDVYTLLRAAGDGSANDNVDIAAGFIPRSLRIDVTHLNAAGYAIVAQAFYSRTRSFGG